jgi:hypothetical protein
MRSWLLSLILLSVVLASSVLANAAFSVNNTAVITPFVGRWFDYVVVIMMENHSINYTYGVSVGPNSWNSMSTNTCLGNCTYFDSLADQNAFALNYTNLGVTDGSISDYTAMTSGDGSLNSACNNGPTSSGCPPLAISNIVDRLEGSNLSWKAYMEDYPVTSGCYNQFASHYFPNHNPFVYYQDVVNNPSRCDRIVNANLQILPQANCAPTSVQNDDLFLADLTPANASNYMFLAPNSVDDIHNCNDVSLANGWLQQLVPRILNSMLFQTRRAALFVTFDEAGCTNPGPPQPSCPSAGPQLYSVWASNSTSSAPPALVGFKSNRGYTHFSALRTVEDNWGLPPLIASTDGSANNMGEFFHTGS